MNFDIHQLLTENIRQLVSKKAAEETSFEGNILLDKNENALGSPLIKWYNRYPQKKPYDLLNAIAKVKSVQASNIFLSNGSYELPDLLFRSFCNQKKDNIIICSPGDGVFENVALLNNVEIRTAPLLENFQLDLVHLETLADDYTKVIFLNSPNNITGNSLLREDVEMVLNNFHGLVVLDETYVNFSKQQSFLKELDEYPNLIVFQNFDIAWGLAGLQVSILFGSEELIAIFEKIKPVNNINNATGELLLKALEEVGMVNDMIKELVQMRAALKSTLEKFPFVEKVFPSDANFLLIKMKDAKQVYDFLLQKNIQVKDVTGINQCESSLRITIGTERENVLLVDALVDYYDLYKTSF